MKKLLCLLLLTSCGFATGADTDETIPPLPTTGKAIPTPSRSATKTDTQSVETFIDNFYINYPGFKSLTRQETIDWGVYWCELLQNGLTPRDIIREIDVYYASPDDAEMMHAIFTNAMLDLCPTNQ